MILYWFGHAPLDRLGDAKGDIVIQAWNVPNTFLWPTGELGHRPTPDRKRYEDTTTIAPSSIPPDQTPATKDEPKPNEETNATWSENISEQQQRHQQQL